eukprot:TRINITY_DN47894_c0_g1_i1.p1 TRINITY_DN47894_c0_g1~~TRINITY_DN47894_c0_g1_i1.p1  ORF type:complete len:105 (+),score=11.67 TRINITY_DN47894_c0_g1_i1:58-372(+)
MDTASGLGSKVKFLEKLREKHEVCKVHCKPQADVGSIHVTDGIGPDHAEYCDNESDDHLSDLPYSCLLYTSDAADEEDSVDLGGRRIIKKKKKEEIGRGVNRNK